jgi:hypothetical protein
MYRLTSNRRTFPQTIPSQDWQAALLKRTKHTVCQGGMISSLIHSHSLLCSAYILFVIQPDERNLFDQRWLDYELLEKYVCAHRDRVCACDTRRSHSRSTQPPDMPSASSVKPSSSSLPPHHSPVPPVPSCSPSPPIPTRSRYRRSTSARDTPRLTFPQRHTGQHVSPSNEAARLSVQL